MSTSAPIPAPHCRMVACEEERERRGEGANVWILSPDFQSVVFCSQRGSITVTHRLRPIPNTAVFLAGRHRAEPRNWISAPCDTTSLWPSKRGFIMEINRLLLGTRVLCLSGQSYLSAEAGEKKRVCLMALTLCHLQGRKNG